MRNALVLLVCAALAASVAAVGLAPEPNSIFEEAKGAMHFVFHSIPLPGHVNPLLAQAEALVKQGHRATIATAAPLRDYVLAHKHPEVQFLETGKCAAEKESFDKMITASLAENDASQSSALIIDWIYSTHPCMYPDLVAALRPVRFGQAPSPALLAATPNLAYPVDVIVTDVMTMSGADAARALDVELVFNNADLLYVLSMRVLPPADYAPMMFVEKSSFSLGSGLLERFIGPPLRAVVSALVTSKFGSLVNARRAASGIKTPLNLFRSHASNLIIQNSAFGLEPARPTPPQVHLVGPCLPASHRPDSARDSLSAADAAWLEGAAGPVALLSMGTLARLSQAQTQAILRGALDAGLAEGRVRLLWKADADQMERIRTAAAEEGWELEGDHKGEGVDGSASSSSSGSPSAKGRRVIPSAHLRATKWVSSQLGVLVHPSTRVFVSHCGINSAHETALAAGGRVQLLCIPMFGDQLDMAQRVRDAGVGLYVRKHQLTPHVFSTALNAALAAADDPVARARGSAVRRALTLAGGAARAAELLVFAGRAHRESRAARAAAMAAAGGHVPAVRYYQQQKSDAAAEADNDTATGIVGTDVYDPLGSPAPALTAAAYAAASGPGGCAAGDDAFAIAGKTAALGYGCGALSGLAGVWVPRDAMWETWEWYNADTIALWVALAALGYFFCRCCRCCCCGSGSGSGRRSKDTKGNGDDSIRATGPTKKAD